MQEFVHDIIPVNGKGFETDRCKETEKSIEG